MITLYAMMTPNMHEFLYISIFIEISAHKSIKQQKLVRGAWTHQGTQP